MKDSELIGKTIKKLTRISNNKEGYERLKELLVIDFEDGTKAVLKGYNDYSDTRTHVEIETQAEFEKCGDILS